MQNMGETRKLLREFMLETFLFDNDESRLADDASFLEQGIIDSTGILELINWLESTFSIQILDMEMLPENLDSINQLLVFINKKTGREVAAVHKGVAGAYN